MTFESIQYNLGNFLVPVKHSRSYVINEKWCNTINLYMFFKTNSITRSCLIATNFT
jgi:hypothetical protein